MQRKRQKRDSFPTAVSDTIGWSASPLYEHDKGTQKNPSALVCSSIIAKKKLNISTRESGLVIELHMIEPHGAWKA